MTTKHKNHEKDWIYGSGPEKWVLCLSCYQEFYIEGFELNPECPSCGSREYEDSDKKDFLDYNELDDLL